MDKRLGTEGKILLGVRVQLLKVLLGVGDLRWWP